MPSPSPDLVEALKNGKAIAIVGSGLTTQVGGPSWDDLLYGILAEACKIRPEETEKIKAAFQEIKDNHLLGAAALLKSVLGSGFPNAVVRQIDWKRALLPRKEIKEMDDICDALFETCGPCEKRNLIPSINHRMIMQLPFRAIITTNYDRLLEKASTAEKINSVFTRSYPYLPKRVVEGKWFLLKVHGCVDTPEDIILSRDDYRKALFGEPLHDMLDSLFKTNEKFWIGYGHNDPTLDFLVDECREKLHLNGGFAAAKKQNYVLQNRFETAGIQPSWLDDYSQISGFLRKLAEATNSPLIFEIIVKCEWTGEQDALYLGKRIAEAFSKLGGDFELFRVENGSVRLFLETRAATLDEFHARLSGADPEILKIIKQFNISSFDGSDVTNLFDNGIKDEIKSAKSTMEDVKDIKHSFPVPRQIPPPPRDFKGREDEIRDILSNFEKGATITGLRGMGGIGKTALALVLAEKIKSQFPDGQIFVDMRGTSNNPELPPLTPAEAMAQVIRAYNPADRLPENSNELRGLYLSILAGKRALLLLDNAANGEQVEPLLPPAGCAVLITSRIKFALPGLAERDLDILPSDKACELLLGIAPRIGNRADELAKRCGYLPIALRNAAGALAEKRDLSVPEYERLLKDKVALLKLVKGSFSLSYDLLTPGRKKQWRRLSVFPEDFDRNAAIAVLKMAPGPSAEALSDLVRWSLVDFAATPDSEEGRYKLHDLARLFAESCLEGDESSDAQEKHAKHYSKVLSQAENFYQKGGTNVLAGLKLFDREWANIKIGQAWVKNIIPVSSKLKKSDLKSVLELASSYAGDGGNVLNLRLHPQVKIGWLETGLKAEKMMGDQGAQGTHLGNLGGAYAALGETRKAIGYQERALKISRKIGDRRGEQAHLGNLGNRYANLGETRKAIEYYEQALAIARKIGDRSGEGNHLGNLGNRYANLGETRKAIEYHQRALTIAQEIGDKQNEGDIICNLGKAYLDLNETSKAIEYCMQSLDIVRKIEYRKIEGEALCTLGKAYFDLGELNKAIDHCDQALNIFKKMEYRMGEGEALFAKSQALHKLGQRTQATALANEALQIFSQIESPLAEKVRQKLAEWAVEN
jgi:tetratricopeptide (TPR) repeat protein